MPKTHGHPTTDGGSVAAIGTMPSNKLDPDDVIAAVQEDDMLGFCKACGEEAYNVEPDARNYTCESCGARQVFGAEECLMELV